MGMGLGCGCGGKMEKGDVARGKMFCSGRLLEGRAAVEEMIVFLDVLTSMEVETGPEAARRRVDRTR